MTSDRHGRPLRFGRLIGAVDARLRSNEKPVRIVLGLLGVALLAVLGTAAWTIVVEMRAEHAASPDPREAYVYAVQSRIHDVTQATVAGTPARQQPAILRVRIQLDADGSLASASIMQSSGDPDLDELTLRIIRSAAPFEPFPPEMRRTTKIVELYSEFFFR